MRQTATIDDMLLFACVVERGGLSAAALELDLSRSLVSKRIAALEARLGARLLNRTTRRLSLTEPGEAYFGYCVQVRDTLAEAEARVADFGERPRGVLRLAAPVTFGELYVAPLLAEFLAAHPGLVVDMDLDDRFVDLVDGGYDLAIRIGALEDSTLVARRLATTDVVVVGAPAYFARHGVPRHPEELRDHNCLTYRHHRGRRDEWRFTGPDGVVTVRVSGNLRSTGIALRNAARAGLGLTYPPRFMVAADIAAGRLQPVLTDWCRDGIGIHAVTPQGRQLPAKTRALIDFLRERLAAERQWTHADEAG